MRVACATLLLLLSVAVMFFRETDAFSFSEAINAAVKTGADWVKDNCKFDINKGITCDGVSGTRSRRSADDQFFPVPYNLDNVCPKMDVGADAKLSDVTDAAFREMDSDKDGSLGIDESVRFTKLFSVLDYCSDLNGKKAVN